jgi:5'-3' exonuclease
MAKILLLDISSIVHPAWHVHGNDPDPNSVSTNAVARARALAHGHDFVAVCADSGKSFRADLDPEYKAHRESKPEAFRVQYARTLETLEADGYLVVKAPGFEADDIIASAATWASANGHEVVTATADKDLLQLLADPAVTAYSITHNEPVTAEGVLAKFGVRPGQMREFLALVGDASDNIRGVPGVGPKRAADLLGKFGTLAALFSAVNDPAATPASVGIAPGVFKALRENGPAVDRALELITLRTDVPCDWTQLVVRREPKPLPGMGGTEEDGLLAEFTAGDPPPEVELPFAAPAVPPSAPKPPEAPEVEAEMVPPKPKALSAEPAMSQALATVEWSAELEPRNMAQAIRLAEILHNSRLFSAYGTPQAVLAVILSGRERGIPAMASLGAYHIIDGKPSMSAGLMHALVLKSGLAEKFTIIATNNTAATLRIKRVGDDEALDITYTIDDAKMAKLVKDGSGWTKNPADMLVARVIARGARLKWQDVVLGLYTPEELGREDLEAE